MRFPGNFELIPLKKLLAHTGARFFKVVDYKYTVMDHSFNPNMSPGVSGLPFYLSELLKS